MNKICDVESEPQLVCTREDQVRVHWSTKSNLLSSRFGFWISLSQIWALILSGAYQKWFDPEFDLDQCWYWLDLAWSLVHSALKDHQNQLDILQAKQLSLEAKLSTPPPTCEWSKILLRLTAECPALSSLLQPWPIKKCHNSRCCNGDW